MKKETLLILDGNSLMFRAFYALPLLTNSEGLHTNALYGFTNMLIRMKEEIAPDYIVTAFDRKAPTFRHDEYKEYKAGRKKMPPELAEQFPIVKELLKMMAIDIFEIDGFEADDLIGTLAKFAEEKGIDVYIVTGDRDALQLASDHIKVIINKKGMTEKEIYDKARMINDFGVTPQEYIDVKGLMGDTSDNIPGVPGIGEKTAFKLIQQYKSIENVLSNIESISGKKIKENLLEYSEQAIFSKRLATIVTDVPVELDLESIKSKENYDAEGVRQLFFRLQFKSLVDKILVHKDEKAAASEEVQFKAIREGEEFLALAENIKNTIFLIFDVENPHIYSRITLQKIYLHEEGNNYIIDIASILAENAEAAKAGLKKIFENHNIEKVCHDIKGVFTIIGKYGIEVKGLKFDTMVAAYLIDSSKGEYKIKDLIQQYLRKDITGEGEELNIKAAALLPKLYELFSKEIKNTGMEELFYNLEMPLIPILASMENLGFRADREKLEDIGEKFKKEIHIVQKEIYELSEEEFNINSPKQLGKILFEKLDLPVQKKTKTGYSTNAEVLEELNDKHPIIEKITYYRQLTKLFSTYVEGLKAVIDTDGKIHSSFNQTVTTTGRLSSTEPNLQNIPVKYEMGREIRKIFVPENEESVILSADYSQIELRVLAHIADDENLINAFKAKVDIHTKTASEVFNVPLEEVTKTLRSNAKAVNFGIVYGIGEFSLAKDLKISRKEAKTYIDTYFKRYPNVKKYMEDIVKSAARDSYVLTIMNRRRFIPEIKATNKVVQALGERLAMNAPIQGSAADIIKLAMVKVYDKLKSRNLKSTLILQVHDELILNVYKDELEEVKSIVKEGMENVMKLSVPMEVDINLGQNWYEAK